MQLNSLSKRFDGNVLVWERQLPELMRTKDSVVHHFVAEKYQKSFTTLSIVQAIATNRFTRCSADADGETFFKIDYNNLVEVE